MKHKERLTLSRAEIAQRLRGLAEQFESGTLHVGDVGGPVPDRAEAELEYEVRDGKGELELEITWWGETATGV